MVVGCITTCAISAYHHYWCEFEFHPWRGVLYNIMWFCSFSLPHYPSCNFKLFFFELMGRLGLCVTVINTTFNNISIISCRSVLLVEETWVPRENHRPVANHWQALSHNVVEYTSPWVEFELTPIVVIGTEIYNNTDLVFLCQTADYYYPNNYYIGTVHHENLLSEK
jgi:hypothetical protein